MMMNININLHVDPPRFPELNPQLRSFFFFSLFVMTIMQATGHLYALPKSTQIFLESQIALFVCFAVQATIKHLNFPYPQEKR